MFKINAQKSTLIDGDGDLNKLETVITPLGSLHLIETVSVNRITAGLGRNLYFPPNTGKHYTFRTQVPSLLISFIFFRH